MNNQQGSSLVVALILLTIITLVTVYALEGSTIQSKMVANSLLSTLTYQECRNEQEANVRHYGTGSNRSDLIDVAEAEGTANISFADGVLRANTTAKSDVQVAWDAVGNLGISGSTGNAIDSASQTITYTLEHECRAVYGFASNSQTIGVRVEALKKIGDVN